MALYRQPCRARRHNAIRARAKVKSYTTMENAATENPSGAPARLRRLNIGPRLAACFLIIVVLMGAVDFIAAWQFKHIEVSAQRFYQVDQKSLAVMRAHVDLMEFREALNAGQRAGRTKIRGGSGVATRSRCTGRPARGGNAQVVSVPGLERRHHPRSGW